MTDSLDPLNLNPCTCRPLRGLALSKISDLKVAARTSAFSFKGRNTNVSEIGTALHVNTVLEGSVRKSANRLRITAQLINAADGYHLWSERYDREMKISSTCRMKSLCQLSTR